MSEYVFVTMSHDYADEFDVECCFVAKKEEFEKQMNVIRLAFDASVIEDDHEYYFGTNEYLSFNSFDDFERGVEVKPCSEEFYNEWFNLTAGSAVGFCVLDRLYETAVQHARALKRAKEQGE